MPNTAVRAAGEAMSAAKKMSRRSIIVAIPIIAGAAALPMAADAATHVHDPLLDTIAEYRAGCEAFCAAPNLTQAEEDACYFATVSPSLRRLNNWQEPACGLRAVAEAIRLILEGGVDECLFSEPLLKASLAYLDSLGGVA